MSDGDGGGGVGLNQNVEMVRKNHFIEEYIGHFSVVHGRK